MTKRTKGLLFFLPLLLVVPLLLTWNSVFAPPIKRAQNFNVILLTIDTTRADFIGAYGNPNISTPNIDSLARDGVLFEHFYSTINTTLAAHSSIFTGLYPRNHGVGRNSMRLNQSNLTIAEFLHVHGYNTAAFIGSFALSSLFGINQGFQTFDEAFIGNMSDYIGRNAHFKNKDNQHFEIVLPKLRVGEVERRAEDVNKSFFSWLDKNKNTKFFAFVHYYDPHFPYNPPEEWYRKRLNTIPAGVPLTTADRPQFEKVFENMTPALEKFQASSFNNFPLPNSMDALLKLYASEIEYSDSAVGKIINKLNETGLRNKTIFIVTADHGENLVDHPEFKTFFRHGFLTHDTEMHIPFIVSCPGYLPSGNRINQVASEVDIFPTVADLLGFHPPRVDGISMLKEFFGQKIHSSRDVFAEASQPHIDLHEFQKAQMVWVNDRNSAFARKGDYKYIQAPWMNYEAVFNLHDDPREQKNVLGDVSKGDLKKFRKDLKEWRSKAALGNIDSSFQLSDEEREKLKSLGYVQ